MSRILLFSPWARYTPHFETDLELLQNHIDAGDEVHFVGCDAEMIACDRNPLHDLVRCNVCIGKREAGLSLLSAPVRRVPLHALAAADRAEIAALETDFVDTDELKAFQIDEFDVGFAVLSTMVSFVRDSDPMAPDQRGVLRDLMVSALAVFRSFQRHLDRTDYDRVYVFNGRFAITRAVLRACTSRGVDCYTHDRGNDLNHYALFRNTTIHDLDRMDHAIQESWDQAEPAVREATGARFYEDRAQGRQQNWYSFTAAQDDGALPRGFDASAHNIVIFNSSEDEFIAIGDAWRNPLYSCQSDAVLQIARALLDQSDVHIYLRVHPNLCGVNSAQAKLIAEMDVANLTVIPAESPVSSYALLRAATKVVTFGSSVGIEAVYWGIPSVLAGQCFYRRLGGVYVPETHEELVEMLRGDLPPGPREPALKYGFHMNSFGERYRHYASDGVFEGRFNGRRVRPSGVRFCKAAFLRAARPIEQFARRRDVARLRAGLLD